MSTEKEVRDAWAAFVEKARAAKHLVVCPGTSINSPVRISQVSPEPSKDAAPKPAAKKPIFSPASKDAVSENKGAAE